MNLQLTGKHVLITGGTRGIGKAIAEAFREEGAMVHIISRNVPLEPGEFFCYGADVIDIQSLENIAPEIYSNTGGKLDVVVCNAGSGAGTPEAIPDTDEWYRLWNLNFDGVLNTMRVFGAGLKETKGNAVFISSIAGKEYLGAPTAYATAKTALIGLAKNLSFKMAPEVRVNVIAPGNIYFEDGTWEKKVKENSGKVEQMLNEKVALKRFGKPEEIADIAVFLASPRAAFITGACIVADGGQTLSY